MPQVGEPKVSGSAPADGPGGCLVGADGSVAWVGEWRVKRRKGVTLSYFYVFFLKLIFEDSVCFFGKLQFFVSVFSVNHFLFL